MKGVDLVVQCIVQSKRFFLSFCVTSRQLSPCIVFMCGTNVMLKSSKHAGLFILIICMLLLTQKSQGINVFGPSSSNLK